MHIPNYSMGTLLALVSLAGSFIFFVSNIKPTVPSDETVIRIDIAEGEQGEKIFLYDTLKYHPGVRDELQRQKNGKATLALKWETLFFHYNPYLFVWLLLASICITVSLGLLPFLLDSFNSVRRYPLKKKDILSLVLVLAAASVVLFLVPHHQYLFGNNFYLDAEDVALVFGILFKDPDLAFTSVLLVPLLVGLICLMAQAFVGVSMKRKLSVTNLEVHEEVEQMSAQYRNSRRLLKAFLVIPAILIALAIVTTDTMRLALMASVEAPFPLFPKEFVSIYGLFFTCILSIFFLPAHYQIRACGKLAMSKLSDNEELRASFSTKESNIDLFKVTFSILAPFISSTLADVMNFIS